MSAFPLNVLSAEPQAPQLLACTESSVQPPLKWVRLLVAKCRDADGREFDWEYVERTTKYRETDGVGVFAKVVAEGQPDRLLVIAQWRPPVRSFVLELPAGVIERGETVEQVAARELREETGFVGQVHRVTPEACNDQGLTNSCLNFAFATVDAGAPANADPTPQPELGETLQVLLLPVQGLAGSLLRLKEERGWAIDSRLLAFALGLDYLRA